MRPSSPEQIFVFSGFALRANSLGHVEQIESYAPGHQVRFGNLNYTTDIRGDLIFGGFEPMTGAPNSHDGHDLALPLYSALEVAPASAPTLNSEQIAPSKDGWMDPATKAAHSAAIEPNADFVPHKARDSEVPDSSPNSSLESDWAPIMEFTVADIFQRSPFGDILNSLKSLSLSG